MYCCPECFNDRGLRRDIFPLLSQSVGQCSYCSSENVLLLPPKALAEYFELLISAYQPDPSGKLLVQCFREDWGLFDHPRIDDSKAKDLLAEIVDDGEIVRKPFIAAFAAEGNQLTEWEKLREELRYRNRFFPEADIKYERLASLLGVLGIELSEFQQTWFRARIQSSDDPYPIEKMGAPPKELAAHGRANPAGIPYLYVASTELTAISETRPHTGELICIASFSVEGSFRVVDLRTPKKTVSPFLLDEPEEIGKMRSDLPFLERLGEELTRPVLPHAAAVDYTPSQFLCEFVKRQGYDGVLYRSSVSSGINLALFDATRRPHGAVRQFRVNAIAVDVGLYDSVGN